MAGLDLDGDGAITRRDMLLGFRRDRQLADFLGMPAHITVCDGPLGVGTGGAEQCGGPLGVGTGGAEQCDECAWERVRGSCPRSVLCPGSCRGCRLQ
jgi:hypothetical protein